MMCPNGCRELVQSPKQFIEFPIDYETGSYKIGCELAIRTCPCCDYTEMLEGEEIENEK